MNHTFTNGLSPLPFSSHGFSVPPFIVPNSAFYSNNKKVNRTVLIVVKSSSNSSSVVGFDVDFKPSFDDFIKAMESVKTVREKRRDKTDRKRINEGGNDKGNEKDSSFGSVRDDRNVVYGENMKWVKDRINIDKGNRKDSSFDSVRDDQGSICDSVQDEKKFKNEKWVKDIGYSREFKGNKKDSSFYSVLDDRKVVYDENMRWVNDRIDVDKGNDRGSIRNLVQYEGKFRTGKWVKDKSYSGEFKGDRKDFSFGLVLDDRKVVYGENMRWVKDKIDIDKGNDGGSIRDSVQDERKFKNEKWVKDNGYSGKFRGDRRGFVCNSVWDEKKFAYGENVRLVRDKSGREFSGDSIGDESNYTNGNNARWVRDKSGREFIGDSIRDERNYSSGDNARWVRDKSNVEEDAKGDSRGLVSNSVRDEKKFMYGENVRWVKDKDILSENNCSYSTEHEFPTVTERKHGYGKDVRWEKGKASGEVENKVNRGSSRNWNRDKPEVNENKFGVYSTKKSDSHGRNVRWDENQGNSTFVTEKDYGFKVSNDRIQGKDITHGRNVRWEENECKNSSTIEDDRSFRVDKDRSNGNEMVLRNGKLYMDNKVVRRGNSDGDEEFGFERAAFESMGGVDDVVDKPRISRNVMEERIQKLARGLNGADVNMPEWMFSKMIRSARIRFSDHSILRIIQLLGKLGNWRRVLQVIDWLQSRERFNAHKLRFIYTTALSVLGKARRPVEALNLFQTMLQQISTYPDLVAYHSIAVTLGQAGHMRELFDVIDIMKSPPKKKFKNGILEKWDPRLEPDIVVYNAVLNACVRRKQWEGAFWVLQQFQEKRQPPSGTTYGLVMEVMLACGKYNLVHDFYKKVLKSSIPNAVTYKVLVNTLWREGKADEAVLAVEDMERRGVVGSAALYYDLARCLCCAGRCQEALLQVEKICRVANKPLVVTYTGLMQACLDAGNIEDGTYVFKHMHKFCSPNLVTCNIILKAYIEHGKFDEANSLFYEMLENGNHVSSKADHKERVIPDTYSFNTMLDACVEEKRWDEFEVVYNRMLEYGYPFNAKRHLRMILDAGRAGKGGLLETTWNYLIRNGQILPPHPLLKEIFCMKLEQGDNAVALSYISNHHPSNLQVFSQNAWLNFFQENAHRLQKDSLLWLVNEVSFLKSKSDTQNLILQNLVLACKEFLKTCTHVSQTDYVETQTVNC